MPLRQSIIVVTIVALVFSVSFVLIDRYTVRQKMGDLMNLADAKYVNVLDLINESKNITAYTANNAAVRESLLRYEAQPAPAAQNNLNSQLKEIQSIGHLGHRHAFGRKPLTRDRFHEIAVTNVEGQVVGSSDKNSIGKNLAMTSAWRARRKEAAVTGPSRKADGHDTFTITSPVYSEPGKKGRFLGVVINEIETRLLTMIMNADIGNVIGGKLFFAGFQYKSLDLYVMDKGGRFMTQSRLTKKNTVLTKRGSDLPLRRTLDEKSGGERTTNVGISTGARETLDIYENRDGVVVAGASMPIFEQGWTVVIEQQTKDAFGGLITLERAMIFGGILAAFLAGLAAWVSARQITNSLNFLNAGSVRLAGGDLETPLNVRGEDYNELATLGQSFDLMRQNLKQTLASLRKSNEQLGAVQVGAKRTLDELLEFIRPSALSLREESLNQLIDEAIGFVAKPGNVTLEKRYDETAPKIRADRPKILQTMINIIARAVDAVRDGGSVTITTYVQNGKAMVSVVDTGAGIEPKEIVKLYEPTFSALAEAQGLALPVARRYVEQHGGKFMISNLDPNGTEVTVWFPLEKREAA